jgi:hypothetical protein
VLARGLHHYIWWSVGTRYASPSGLAWELPAVTVGTRPSAIAAWYASCRRKPARCALVTTRPSAHDTVCITSDVRRLAGLPSAGARVAPTHRAAMTQILPNWQHGTRDFSHLRTGMPAALPHPVGGAVRKARPVEQQPTAGAMKLPAEG